jgi:elongation factor 3
MIPAVSVLCLDIKKEVKQSSRKCLEEMYGTVENKDLAELIPALIQCVYKPELTEPTIDKVASTKFVTTVTAGTISILCPLLLRGYACRKDKTSRLCSKIIVNMLQLVENYADVENFLSVLTPPVQGAFEMVSDPEARHMISECLKQLDQIKNIKDQSSSTVCAAPEGAVELCNCDFTLAYGNKILLKGTNMTLHKGYKYGLIGEGGKSTLLAAISENKVDNFPDASEVKCVFVQTNIVGELSHLSCVEYVLEDEKIQQMKFTEEQVVKALLEFGFGNASTNPNSPAQVEHGVSTLSGGWRMKLALARAMLIDPDILLLESPTDHLDVINIAWIQDYIKNCTKTVIFTSQSKETLNACCTHIALIRRLKLSIFYGNLDALIEKDAEIEEYFKMDKEVKDDALKFTFPEPGALEGVKSRTRAVIKMDNCTFTYPGNTKPTIEDVSFKVSCASRVGVCGKNGEGKSTAIKLLTGENIPQLGSVYKHPGVRLGYLAQHSFDTIDNHPNKTANEYIRWRFEIPGEDREAIKKKTTTLNEEEEAQLLKPYTFIIKDADDKPVKKTCVIEGLTGLRKTEKDKSFTYQVKLSNREEMFLPLKDLETANKVVFGKLVKAVDEKLAAMAGLYIKPLTQQKVEEHLALIGLEPELASHTKLSQLSDGEKVKAVLGACMWMSPHIVVFDEPTNALSWDALVALVAAIKDFQGGVVIISHNQEFVDQVCSEIWLMAKDPQTGIAHLSITGGETTDLKEIFEEKAQADTYIDGYGNEVALKKMLGDKEKKKKIATVEKSLKAAKKKGSNFTEEQIWELEDELANLKAAPMAV